MKTTFKCSHGHDVEVDLPNSFFRNAYLKVPCLECGEIHLVDKKGNHEVFVDDPYHDLLFMEMKY